MKSNFKVRLTSLLKSSGVIPPVFFSSKSRDPSASDSLKTYMVITKLNSKELGLRQQSLKNEWKYQNQ